MSDWEELIASLFGLAVWGLVGYGILHFVIKYW